MLACPLAALADTCDVGKRPAAVRIGNLRLCPSAFFETIGVFRSAAAGESVSTAFEKIPTVETSSQTLGTIRHSRVMLRSGLSLGPGTLRGYFESDFLNTPGEQPFRVRQYWAEYERHGWQFLVGQAWSLLRANRKGTSSDSDSFDTDVIDPNYHVGLLGFRKRQVRITRQLGPEWKAALSLEKGGDIGYKIAHDRNRRHFEVMGLVGRHGRRGLGVALSVPVSRTVNLTTQQFITKGAGHEALGLLPPAVTGYAGIAGLEWQARKNLEIYTYAGLVYGSPSSGTRVAREATIGFTNKVYTSARFGVLAIAAQFSAIERALWTGGDGALSYGMVSMRYSFPQ